MDGEGCIEGGISAETSECKTGGLEEGAVYQAGGAHPGVAAVLHDVLVPAHLPSVQSPALTAGRTVVLPSTLTIYSDCRILPEALRRRTYNIYPPGLPRVQSQ